MTRISPSRRAAPRTRAGRANAAHVRSVTHATPRIHRRDAGFSLIDMMIVIALMGIIAGMAVPAWGNLTESMKLASNAREVERELQTARLKAVTANRPIRVRFNCPVAGQYRMVELIGSVTAPHANDVAANRCQEVVYPYPAADREPLTRPNHDGPLRRLAAKVTFGAAAHLEFWPDGSVRKIDGTAMPMEITLVKDNAVRKITVNSLGKITLVP
jgi:prepilin-type N-terminal cleavage/methylation domain-containing protein